MHLLEALGVASAQDLDSTRSLRLGPLELGTEAAVEAARILAGGEFPNEVNIDPREITAPYYWAIAHKGEGLAECFGFPSGVDHKLPTAAEIALVQAVAAAEPNQLTILLEGDAEISIGPAAASDDFRKILRVVDKPMAGDSLLFDGATQALIDERAAEHLNNVVLSCLSNSFRTSPLKFRFLELYRIIEARFLAEIKHKLITSFDAEPNVALRSAVESLKSEMGQIVSLAETQQDAFESCWNALDQLNNANQFCTALFRKLSRTGGGGKWKTGAALIYQIRCAIVHAGEKDLIFENFPDGQQVVETVLPHVERAALLLVGVELS